MRYSVSFKGERCESYGILPINRPEIPALIRDIELVKIPGRSGLVVRDRKRYKEIRITINFNFLSGENEWSEVFRKARRWLSGSGELELSDDMGSFYKVFYAEVSTCEREMKRTGRFMADFVCDPFSYLKRGKQEHERQEVLYNPYYEAHPVYVITGEGICVLSVNGKEMEANIGQNLTIDTERMVAYRTDGVLNNTSVLGDYEDLYLKEGDNQIMVTQGFGLKVIPNWRR